MNWRKAAIIGIGLLGGSIGLGLKNRRMADRVAGYVRRTSAVQESLERGLVDFASTDLETVVTDADLIILCTPIAQMEPLATQMVPFLSKGTIVTDVGSVKAGVIQVLEPIMARAGAIFIGSHPMAGSEQTGLQAAKEDLFEKAICVLTPQTNTDRRSLTLLESLWKGLGMEIMRMSAEKHDDLVSRSSHLPHIVAAELANYVLSPALPKDQRKLCAGGFKDTSRVASGSPEMWRDIALANRKNLMQVLGVFIEDLEEFRLALEREDLRQIDSFFQSAKKRRDDWLNTIQAKDKTERTSI